MCSILLTLKSCIYKIKLKTNPYTAFSIDNDAHIYYWDIQGAATFFPGVKCRGEGGGRGKDLNKCQIPANMYLGLNLCQVPIMLFHLG